MKYFLTLLAVVMLSAFTAKVGKGNLYAFGPEITFRAQPYGTFKLLFNGLYQ